MGNSLRCCLSCVLPCGALDVVRIVHLNGHVDEYSRPVFAKEIHAANPNHVLRRPCVKGGVRQIIVVSSDSELKRGQIYFLIPLPTLSEKKSECKRKYIKNISNAKLDKHDNYLSEILPEKKSSSRRRRSVRVGVWRPHLESIHEE